MRCGGDMTARPYAKFFQKEPGIFQLFAQLYGVQGLP